MVEPAPEDATDALRVFVVFSGMAGAWRATRELEGRFFGGKKLVSCGCEVATDISLCVTLTKRCSTVASATALSEHNKQVNPGAWPHAAHFCSSLAFWRLSVIR